MRLAVVDDEPANIDLFKRIFDWAGFHNVHTFTNPLLALEFIRSGEADLLILDLHMPRMDGFQFLAEMRSETFVDPHIPVLVFTADATSETRLKALGLGASDFLTKPGDATEIMLRVRNMLEIRFLNRELQVHNSELEELVKQRTAQLDLARFDALERLALTAEFRDDETGEHAKRVGRLSAEIATQLNAPTAKADLIELAAPLHDIGKVGIPDSILHKPGKLTPEEFEVMKTHTKIGAKILSGSTADEFAYAAAIALSHHERWNGQGYPLGLHGEQIPLPGRIVAVADVFDALTHERSYKEAWPVQQARDYLGERAGTEFDPNVIDAFLGLPRTSIVPRAA